jgi:hypothetical protein
MGINIPPLRRMLVGRICRPREDQVSCLDLDLYGIAFAETGSQEPPAAETDHRDARPLIEV